MLSASHTSDERVRISLLDHVADVRLTRPDKMNALDLGTIAALDAAGKWIEEQPCVRAVVLSGEGPCVSADLI